MFCVNRPPAMRFHPHRAASAGSGRGAGHGAGDGGGGRGRAAPIACLCAGRSSSSTARTPAWTTPGLGLVVRARELNHVRHVLYVADWFGAPVYARGLGSGLSGGAVPTRGGIVLDVSPMDALLQRRAGQPQPPRAAGHHRAGAQPAAGAVRPVVRALAQLARHQQPRWQRGRKRRRDHYREIWHDEALAAAADMRAAGRRTCCTPAARR